MLWASYTDIADKQESHRKTELTHHNSIICCQKNSGDN